MKHFEHIAIIPDGNRRWAASKNKASWEGHIEGSKRVEELLEAIPKLGVKYLTIWGSSYDNLIKRSKTEITALDKIYKDMAVKAAKSKAVSTNELKICFVGEYETLLSSATVKALKKIESSTSTNNKYVLTCLIGYNGDREMLAAINKTACSGVANVSRETFATNLWTSHLPPVDLVIRTGKDPHLSNGFMMWLTQNSIIHFSDKMWPDFYISDLKDVIETYKQTEKRLGR